jgi:hypothetical protein
MPISNAALQTEIQTDPQTLGYAGKTAAQIVVLLNTKGSAFEPAKTGATWTLRDGNITRTELEKWAGGGPRAKIRTRSDAAGTGVARSGALLFEDFFRKESPSFNVDATGMTALLNAMETDNSFSNAEKLALLALGDVSCTRGEKLANQLNYVVTLNDVAQVL